jgi:hypothetical protein
LGYLMLLREKRTVITKGRSCADGRKQLSYGVFAIFFTYLCDAMERRYVATTEFPGAFVDADIDELLQIRFEGGIAESLLLINPRLYRKYLFIERAKPVLYAKLAKAL